MFSKVKKHFSVFTRFDALLWSISTLVVVISYLLSSQRYAVNLIASLIGVTALIYLARGQVFGQVLIVAFAVLYGISSWRLAYYGEMITYLGMSMPIAIASIITWLRHPYKGAREVEVSDVKGSVLALIFLSGAAVTAAFYFILRALGNAELIVSTVSVFTSFLAAALSAVRSPFYALGYAANDVVLIILWCMASVSDLSNLPMLACFAVFLINDLYGFVNWRKMQKRQRKQGERQ